MRRRCLGAFLLYFALLLLLFPVSALAETVRIDDLYLEAQLPEGWVAITRNTSANDPAMGYITLPHADMMEYLETQDLYVYAFPLDEPFDLMISTGTNELGGGLFHLDESNEADIERLLGLLQRILPTQGMELISHERYKCGDILYLMMESREMQGEAPLHVCQYVTVVNGRMVIVSLSSGYEAAAAAGKQHLAQVVDSIRLTQRLEAPAGNAHALYDAIRIGAPILMVVFVVIGLIMGRKRKNTISMKQ